MQVAQDQIARLASVLRDAHADVRQQILDLRASPSPQQPFLAVIRHYLDGFTSNYDIETRLIASDRRFEEALSAEAQTQLYRILQEALSNARRHSRAQRVTVTFEAEVGRVRIRVEGDGCGFRSRS